MSVVAFLTCWSFAVNQWQTVVMLQDDKGYGVVRLHETGEQVHIGFRWVGDEQVCYMPISHNNENGLHVKE